MVDNHEREMWDPTIEAMYSVNGQMSITDRLLAESHAGDFRRFLEIAKQIGLNPYSSAVENFAAWFADILHPTGMAATHKFADSLEEITVARGNFITRN